MRQNLNKLYDLSNIPGMFKILRWMNVPEDFNCSRIELELHLEISPTYINKLKLQKSLRDVEASTNPEDLDTGNL